MKKLEHIKQFFLREIPIHIINLLTSLLPNHLVTNRIRGMLIKPFIGGCGKKLQVGKGVIINNPGSLFVGDNCYLSHYCYVQAKGKVVLGDSVIIGPMSIIASSDHIFERGAVKNRGISKPIIIGKGTWCGGHVVITSGVKIGDGVIIGAGAVVTKDVDSNSKVVGVPARLI